MDTQSKNLTIIIPTYNMEKYLDKCLTSLIVSDLDLLNQLEVLVVIDGATDRSSEIAHSYESRYPQTFRVIDKENGNYGSCINRGLKEASGKYVKVLDADDSFDTIVFGEYIRLLSSIDVDLFVTDYRAVDLDGHTKRCSFFDMPVNKFFSVDELPTGSNVEMHCITYKTQFLKSFGYQQTEGISYSDSEWATIPFIYVKNIYYRPLFLYLYLIGREGQTIDRNASINKYNDYIITTKKIIESTKGKMQLDYVRRKINWLASLPYMIVLSWNEGKNDDNLVCFDEYLKEYPTIYNEMENLCSNIGYLKNYYVKRWRRTRPNYSYHTFKIKIVNRLLYFLIGNICR